MPRSHSPAHTRWACVRSSPDGLTERLLFRPASHLRASASPLCAIIAPKRPRLYGWSPALMQILPFHLGSASSSYVILFCFTRCFEAYTTRARMPVPNHRLLASRRFAGILSSTVGELTA